MTQENYNRLLWPIIIGSIILVFGIQLILHTDKKFDHCICEDGSISYSYGSGTCSWHGGIKEKIYKKIETTITFEDVFIILIATAVAGPIAGILVYFLLGVLISNQKQTIQEKKSEGNTEKDIDDIIPLDEKKSETHAETKIKKSVPFSTLNKNVENVAPSKIHSYQFEIDEFNLAPSNHELKFELLTKKIPSWPESESSSSALEYFTLPLERFNSIKIRSYNSKARFDKGYLIFFLTIEDSKIEILKKEIIEYIITKHPKLIASVSLGFYLYKPDLSKKWKINFKIEGETCKSVQKNGTYLNYFQIKEETMTSWRELNSISKVFIGFTGLSPEELEKGREILISGYVKTKIITWKYVFITGVKTLKKNLSGNITGYCILPKDYQEQIKPEICHFFKNYPELEYLELEGYYFDETIFDIEEKLNSVQFEFYSKSFAKIQIDKNLIFTEKWEQAKMCNGKFSFQDGANFSF